MKPKYFILNHDNFTGIVYEKDGKKIVFIRNPKINIEFPVEFRDIDNIKIVDDEIMEILRDWLFRPENQ